MAASLRLAPVSTQGALFELFPVVNCRNESAARNAYGNAAQEAAYRLLAIDRIPIDGRYRVNFDGKRGDTYYEMKSLRLVGGKVIVYDCRIEKERATGVPLRYLLICHGLKKERADVLQKMLDGGLVFYDLPAELIHTYALTLKLRTVKTDARSRSEGRPGYRRPGYDKGYRNVSVSKMLKTPGVTITEKEIPNPLGAGCVVLRSVTWEAEG